MAGGTGVGCQAPRSVIRPLAMSFNRKPEACACVGGAHASGLRLNDNARKHLKSPLAVWSV